MQVFIDRRELTFEPRPWDFSMKTQVGGQRGVGETATITNISWPKNEFYEDEICPIKLECDNSACAHAVTNYEVSLIQTKCILIGDAPHTPQINEWVICSQNNALGCQAGDNKEISIDFCLKNESIESVEEWMAESDKCVWKKLASSLKGQLITIDYVMRVEITHDVDAAMDSMTRCDFPVKVLSRLGEQIPMQGDAMEM